MGQSRQSRFTVMSVDGESSRGLISSFLMALVLQSIAQVAPNHGSLAFDVRQVAIAWHPEIEQWHSRWNLLVRRIFSQRGTSDDIDANKISVVHNKIHLNRPGLPDNHFFD